ncbi:MAG: FAD-dependent oxidoreductase [Pseudomonadota bacterium]
MTDSRYDPLFEPIQIGPVTAPNRFYQVPHCSGMGYQRPQTMAAMRGVKAEGGWGVVCTEYCSIDAGSDEGSYPYASLRDDDDIRNLRLMTDAVHAHGALAGVELWYGGHTSANLETREVALDVGSFSNAQSQGFSGQSQIMERSDIDRFREMYKSAAKRAMEAGFDIVYVYGNHYYLLHNFMNTALNHRDDEYGGSIENRVRLLRECIEDVREVVAGRCAVAVRFSIPFDYENDPDQMLECFKLIAELPDLWDFTVNAYDHEMGSSRFVKEAVHHHLVGTVKSLTSKPVVTVGRFTSPDTMLSEITKGNQDFIGAARPSIADPFLPNKIKEGRLDDIRECIGCNICYAHNSRGVPIRCTQNPTMGEEWRRGWHPDRIETKHADETILVVGAGPAGLEAACSLGKRGYSVALAEAAQALGGRINRETKLPGLSEWARVRDWRVSQISRLPNVEVYLDNRLDADAIVELGYQHVVVATGSYWRSDGVGVESAVPFSGHDGSSVVSVEKILNGFLPRGTVVIYDDDHYYLSGAVALKLAQSGVKVVLVTPDDRFAHWTYPTGEHSMLVAELLSNGVEIRRSLRLQGVVQGEASFACVYSGQITRLKADTLIPITNRIPDDRLWLDLQTKKDDFTRGGGRSMQRIGDCRAPGIIAAAVYAGHRCARELGAESASYKRDRVVV